MDGITILALVAMMLVGVAGLILAIAAIRLTQKQHRGRGPTIILAFFLPTLYVAYLLAAGHFRNEYHRTHSKAYESEGYDTLVLGHGYTLWFFDETPWMSSIAAGPYANAEIKNIQRLSIQGTTVFGQTGTTNMLDGPTDYFFALNLSSGALLKVRTESELRSTGITVGPLRKPEDLYNSEVAEEHSSLFWPLICVAPLGLAAGLWSVARRGASGIATPPVSVTFPASD